MRLDKKKPAIQRRNRSGREIGSVQRKWRRKGRGENELAVIQEQNTKGLMQEA